MYVHGGMYAYIPTACTLCQRNVKYEIPKRKNAENGMRRLTILISGTYMY